MARRWGARYNRGVLALFSLPGGCALVVLGSAAVGFVVGLAAHPGLYRESARMGATVQYAQWYGAQPERRPLVPALSRGMFVACVFPWYPVVKGWCPDFLAHSFLFAVALLLCGASCGLWVLADFAFLSSIENERRARIDTFISDGNAEMPPPVPELAPRWLTIWNWVNIAGFVLVMGSVAAALPVLNF